MSDKEPTSEQLEALHDKVTSLFGELKREMSDLRRDVFKLRDDQLQTRALVNVSLSLRRI
jgi:hypothetical protein